MFSNFFNCFINDKFITKQKAGSKRKICYKHSCIKAADKKRYIKRKIKEDLKRHEEIKSNLNNLEYGINYVICEWNKMYLKVITTAFLQRYFPNKTVDDYKNEFPGYPIKCKDAIGFISGDKHHMKQEKYKKMFSKIMSGDNNPSKRRSKQSLKESSPFSKEYYKKRLNITDDEAKLKVSEFATNAVKDRISNTHLDYWVNLYGEEKGKILYKERQTTNGLKYYINKYGKEKGKLLFNDRIKKWKHKMFETGNIPNARSKVSDNFCNILYSFIDLDPNIEVYYGKSEYKIIHKNKYYLYDFTYINYDNNHRKIIEINGDFWHCNPNLNKWADETQNHPIITHYTNRFYHVDFYEKM